jgi:hypothetical protein
MIYFQRGNEALISPRITRMLSSPFFVLYRWIYEKIEPGG